MQRLLIIWVVSALAISLAFASTPFQPYKEVFNPDLSAWDCELAALTELEQWVEGTGMSYTELKEANPNLAAHVLPGDQLSQSLLSSTSPDQERLLGIPGFLWGFCCSAVGMFLVYLAIDDPEAKKREGKQAILGCAVGTLLWTGLYIWLIAYATYY